MFLGVCGTNLSDEMDPLGLTQEDSEVGNLNLTVLWPNPTPETLGAGAGAGAGAAFPSSTVASIPSESDFLREAMDLVSFLILLR